MFGLGAVKVLLVPFVTGELGASEAWFGPLEAAQVAAMVAAATLVAAFSSRLRPKHLISVGAVGPGSSTTSLSRTAAAQTRSAPPIPVPTWIYDTSGTGTCFAHNVFGTSFPTALELLFGCA